MSITANKSIRLQLMSLYLLNFCKQYYRKTATVITMQILPAICKLVYKINNDYTQNIFFASFLISTVLIK